MCQALAQAEALVALVQVKDLPSLPTAEVGLVSSIDISEVNPILDHGNSTAELAVEMILSLLGKTIL